jgi:membrane protease YdiL (CAAX protease family)
MKNARQCRAFFYAVHEIRLSFLNSLKMMMARKRTGQKMNAAQEGFSEDIIEPPRPSPTRTGVWKPLAWAVFCWGAAYGLAFVGAVLANMFAARVLLGEELNDFDYGAYLMLNIGLIFNALLIWIGLRCGKLAAGGDMHVGIANYPIREPRKVAGLIGALLLCGLGIAMSGFNPYPDLPGYLREANPLQLFLMALVVVVAAPLGEELFFRGWLWSALRRHWGELPTALVTGGLWYLGHFGHGLLYMALLAPAIIIITAVRYISGSLRASLLAHAIYNFFCTLVWLYLAFGQSV